jgi:hypothetical protein
LELKNLPTGVGDSFKIEGTYAHGAAKYVFGGTYDTVGAGRFSKIGTGTGTGGSMAFGYVLDGVYGGLSDATGTGISLSDAWDVSASFEHYWNPAWRTSLFGGYSAIKYGSTGNALLVAASNTPGLWATGTFGGTNTGNFDFSVAQIGSRTAWTPVKNLTLSAEVMWTRLHQNQNGTFVAAAGIPGVAAGTTFQMKDQSIWNGGVQLLRSF